MNRIDDIPIFILPAVALPTELIPLHIFEERYKALIADCRERARKGAFADFGFFFYRDGHVHDVGTLVRIDGTLKAYEDGQLDLLVTGKRRCRILNRKKEKLYDTADIEILNDDSADWDEDLANRAFTLHRNLLKMITGEFPEDNFYDGRSDLSFLMAQTSGLTKEQKQRLIEMRCENDRLRVLTTHFEQIIDQIRTTHEKVGSILCSWDLQKQAKK